MNLVRARADFLIVGQGLAGTLLAWEFERAGISFAIADAGHAGAASRVAAGIINPITGRRLVKSWQIDRLLPVARAAYRELEAALGVPLWRDMRVRRLFADDRERRVLVEKRATGDLGMFAVASDEVGFWVEGAARVDLPALLAAARARWSAQGRLVDGDVHAEEEVADYDLVIDCSGVAGARNGFFGWVPWEFSHGETLILKFRGDGAPLPPDVILNRGHWILPTAPGEAWIGATHAPGVSEAAPTTAGRAVLEASARALLPGRDFSIVDHLAGVRVTLPDRHPVAGRHPTRPRLGVVNGLGSKGALHAPALARQWVNHLTEGVAFDAGVAVGRFFACDSSQASSR